MAALTPRGTAMAPLFLISAATVGFEIALTRYFAVAKWSEYGYWVISIVLAGFALSGVALALARDAVARHAAALGAILPVGLIVSAAVGYHFVCTNPFNPLQLQNQATLPDELWNIAGYYAALLPFFFLAGAYISLCFVANDRRIGRVYGFDLTGAGAGALAVLLLMRAVPPFGLLPWLLIPLGAACLFARWRRLPVLIAAVAALAASEALLLGDDEAAFNDFKAIYAPLHVPNAQVLATLPSPRGLYMLLNDFTERVDTDVSNDAGMLGLPGPPETFGLYRDGNRIAALPKPGAMEAPYAAATLAALPYALRPHPKVLLVGTSGGFRIAEARTLGASSIDALEPDPVLLDAVRNGLAIAPAQALGDSRLRDDSPFAAMRPGAGFEVIDYAGDFLDSAEANSSAFSAEAVAAAMRALAPAGVLSVPVSIREFPAYAGRMLATVRAGLTLAGIPDAPAHVLVYRSAWNVRVLISPSAFGAGAIAAARTFCGERSFDLSYYPGIDVAAARANIYNDLPAVSFEAGQVTSESGTHDAIADEAGAVLAGEPTASSDAFDLRPITLDRPSFYSVLRLSQLGTVLKRLEILPQAEVGALVNLAVLAQAGAIALVVLLVPWLAGVRARAGSFGTGRAILYFAALGLGFLFIELFLIDRASFYLNDRTSGFALVLTGMLIFSGLGAMLSGRFAADPARGAKLAIAAGLVWCTAARLGLEPAMLATLDLPWTVRAGLVLLAVAPVSFVLGLPFPLGLERTGSGAFLPWAWGINGAFSVVSTPLANLLALQEGYNGVLTAAAVLYLTAHLAYPSLRKRKQWQDLPAS